MEAQPRAKIVPSQPKSPAGLGFSFKYLQTQNEKFSIRDIATFCIFCFSSYIRYIANLQLISLRSLLEELEVNPLLHFYRIVDFFCSENSGTL